MTPTEIKKIRKRCEKAAWGLPDMYGTIADNAKLLDEVDRLREEVKELAPESVLEQMRVSAFAVGKLKKDNDHLREVLELANGFVCCPDAHPLHGRHYPGKCTVCDAARVIEETLK